ncbi:MAG: glycosyl hydrolase [Zetaproteobacteria bacterium CG2_30_46_52]|nr:MAG: glycosyl hydrolase [Zetaproteobacteria bacterium CG2_30_46_52]
MKPMVSTEVFITSAQGHKQALLTNIVFQQGVASGNVIRIHPTMVKQTMAGIGTSFTEASAFVLAHLEPKKRQTLMEKIWGEKGANFSVARTPIGSTDFCVDGKYTYAEVADDAELQHFSIAHDSNGFSASEYPSIKDEAYDLLPMIHEALAVKSKQEESDLRILASAWTAPPWMKDIEDWYVHGSEGNDYQGTGGWLLDAHQGTYALYIKKYLEAYRQQGVNIWAVTPVNEPYGNNGRWESMHFTPESQRDWIKNHLGPMLKQGQNSDVKIFIFDHNRDALTLWADTIYGDADCAQYVDGAAVHWYESTFKVYEDVFDEVHEKYPQFSIIHSEGCIDDLGNDAPEGVTDPIGFKESGWFGNDDFWWNENATDWAYSTTWQGVVPEDHPMYAPVHRYARNIIVSINHWLSAWVDWNIVLDERGGPNHVGNYCGAPIMINTDSGEIYFTPIFEVLSQFSRSIRPGDSAVQTDTDFTTLKADDVYACATLSSDAMLSVQIFNTTKQAVNFCLEINGQYAEVSIAANALQTIRIPL